MRVGIVGMLIGIVVLLAGIDLDATASVVAVPLILIGLGIGALASQLGAVTVSAVPTEESGDVGGLQNTATNLGASLGTALAGSVMIAILTSSLISGITSNPAVPDSVKASASVELASGVPFISDTALTESLTSAGVPEATATAVLDANRAARIDGLDAALAILALLAVVSLFFTGRIPDEAAEGTEADTAAQPA